MTEESTSAGGLVWVRGMKLFFCNVETIPSQHHQK